MCSKLLLLMVLSLLVRTSPVWAEEKRKRDAHEYLAHWYPKGNAYVVIAKAPVNKVVMVEGVHFFPPEYVFVNKHPIEFFESARTHTHDKIGNGTFYNVAESYEHNANIVKHENDHVALTYKDPSEKFKHIKGFFSFVRKVKIVEMEHYDGHVHHDGMRMYRDHRHHRSDHSHIEL